MTTTPKLKKAVSLASTIGGGHWTVAEPVISQAGQLILIFAAARILSPADFGVFALVSTCAMLLLRMSEVGWAPYIMSWQGDERVPRQVLMVAILSGLGAGVLAALAAPRLGLAPVAGHLLLLFSVWVALARISSAQKGMMIWRDRLNGSVVAESVGKVMGMCVALVTLFHGDGVYALVFGRLTYQTAHLALSFVITRKVPLFGMERGEFRALCSSSWQIFFSRSIANLRLYVATLIIGGFLGTAPVGYYRAAPRLVGAVGEIIGVPSLMLA